MVKEAEAEEREMMKRGKIMKETDLLVVGPEDVGRRIGAVLH